MAAEYEASGLTREAFCRERDVALKTLCRYVTQYRRRNAETAQTLRFVQVKVTPASTGGGLIVLLSGGHRIEVNRGFDAATLRQLLSVLEQA